MAGGHIAALNRPDGRPAVAGSDVVRGCGG